MASVRGARTRREEHQPHRVPRDYQARHPRRHPASAIPQHEPRECPAGTPGARPHRGLQALARVVAQGEAGTLCRTSAERGSETHRGARARDTGIQVGAILSSERHILRHRSRRQEDRGEGRARHTLQDTRRGAGIPQQLQGCRIQRERRDEETPQTYTGTAIYHLHTAAGGSTQAGIHRVADHDARTASL